MALNPNSVVGPLHQALSDFRSALAPEQRARLQALNAVPDAAAVITFTKEVDDENAKRRSRCVASRLCGILESVQQFSSIVDTFTSSHLEIAALVWGSIKFALLFATRFSTYFDKLSTIFMNVHNTCPRYMEYQTLYAGSKKLQAALCNYYATIVRLCQKAIEVGQRHGLQQFTIALWRPFETEFGSLETELQRQSKEVKEEMSLASKQAAEYERQLQIAERRKSSQFRKQAHLQHLEECKWRLQIDQSKSRSRRNRLLKKLSNYNYMSSFKSARKKRHWATTLWLPDTDEYRNWLGSELPLFWCSGLLGTGKTVLTAGVIDDLFCRYTETETGVIFFFCQFDNAESLTARAILGSLTRQCLNAETMLKTVEARLAKLFDNGLPDLDDLQALFVDQITALKSCSIVIDGIDECAKAERNILFTALRKVADCSSRRFKIFIASRPQVGFEIKRVFKSCHYKSMDSPEVHADIAKYIKNVLKEKKDSGDLQVGLELVEEIEDILVSSAYGMYLLVTFQICDICDQANDEDIRKTAKMLPKSLPELYERIITKIVAAGKGEIAKKVFRWVAAAKRPLSLSELREAIAIESGQTVRSSERLANDIKAVVSWCGDLVYIDEEEQVVQFAHPTVKQFFISDPSHPRSVNFHFQISEVNHEAGELCVTYLNFNDFKRQLIRVPNTPLLSGQAILQASMSASLGRGLAGSLSKLRSNRKPQISADDNVFRQLQDIAGVADEGILRNLQASYSFLAYARKYWLLHTADFSRDCSKNWVLWKTLLSSTSFALLPWSSGEWECRSPSIMQWIVEHDHTYFLLESATTYHPKVFDTAINRFTYSGIDLSMAIVAAASGGYIDIVERLLAVGTDVDPKPRNSLDRTALQAASEGGHPEVVNRLLTAEADVNAMPASSGGYTALQAASQGGFLEVVEMLLAAKADVNAEPAISGGRTALQAASGGGHLEIVERLLAAKANANAEPAKYGGRTALQAASGGGHLEIVERLLAAKSNVNAKPASNDGCTALQAASQGGFLEVVERLLSAKANVNAETPSSGGRTALQAASQGGFLEVVERLLSAKANVNAEPARSGGRTALQAASEGGHLEVVERLLAAKANVNTGPTTRGGRTALQAASGGGHLEVVERLLAAEANVNAEPAEYGGRTALQAASEGGHLEVVEGLLVAEANVNAKPARKDGHTALQAASQGGFLEVVERLLAARANVNARPVYDSGRTALQGASERGHLEVVERLLAAKANVNAEPAEYGGHTALQAASEHGHLEVVERLLAAKANVNAGPASAYGRTALQAASGGGHLEIVEKLLAAKANVNAEPAKYGGRTALQAASEHGHLEVVERLLAAKANVNAGPASGDGRTALEAASEGGHLEVVERLISAGARRRMYLSR
ncbi:MAG: hypothetical protein M1839_006235 [Geoglossum umbratile]|nr:MAG: hypothetical protein M1839_006235 [Geoglossum umbratile]